MILYDLSFPDPLENLMCDEMLLRYAQGSGTEDVILRLWESPVVFVVLGMAGQVDADVNQDACIKDHVGIFRRSSGGGTVLQGPGCLNFSFIYPKKNDPGLNDLHRSYRIILQPVLDLLKGLGVEAEFQPLSDLALVDTHQKISGNAQRRLKDHILHHGTILYHFDLSLIEKYLFMPSNVPEYRGGRAHRDFVTNIPVDKQRLCAGFRDHFPISAVFQNLDVSGQETLRRLLEQERGRFEF